MIYALHEMQHAATAPLRFWAETSQQLFTNPFSPLAYLPHSSRVAASSELLGRVARRYEKPEFGLTHTLIDGKTVAVHEEIVAEKPFCRLLRFRRETTLDHPKVLLVAPLSGHHATLLRDTVRTMLPDHDVYITDWLDARLVPLAEGYFHFADYVAYVKDFIRQLSPGLHIISVCQPTVPVLAAISLMAAENDPAQPSSMTMMGGPIDTRRAPTEVNKYAKTRSLRWFDTRVITRVPLKYPGYMRRVYPGFLQHSGFVAMNADRHLQAHIDFYNHLVEGDGESAEAHRKFYDEYNAVMDLPAEYYLETLDMVFMKHALPQGEMTVSGKRVKPWAIRDTALFTIEGELDDISGPGQTEAAHELCRSIPAKKKEHFLVPGVGHYGIFSGRRWRESIYPRVRDF
ncbi:MAG: polyhydroxyalkanoate depolymerase, partial [Gammaproteobacteria bacterium]|nr:polyhydroxyalkanoate depolymerase [Gammaproteobacteria bacterium]